MKSEHAALVLACWSRRHGRRRRRWDVNGGGGEGARLAETNGNPTENSATVAFFVARPVGHRQPLAVLTCAPPHPRTQIVKTPPTITIIITVLLLSIPPPAMVLKCVAALFTLMTSYQRKCQTPPNCGTLSPVEKSSNELSPGGINSVLTCCSLFYDEYGAAWPTWLAQRAYRDFLFF